MNAAKLHSELEKLAPIDHVEIRDANDRSQWVIFFQAEATDDQKAAAQQALLDYEVKPNKSGLEVLLAALEAKGITITAEDLDAAKA